MLSKDFIKSKYFRFKDNFKVNENFFSNLYFIEEYDLNNNMIKAIIYSESEEDVYEFIVNDSNMELFEFIDEEIVIIENEKQRLIEWNKEENVLERKRKCEEFNLIENNKNNNFQIINPNLKRHTKVFLVGKYNKELIDFSKKGDFFYIDDVNVINDEIFYSLRVVSIKKNRGIYIFNTKCGFKEENLKVDKVNNDDMDYVHMIVNEVVNIRPRKENINNSVDNIKLISPDYSRHLEVIRVANRGIVIKDNLVLLCYEEDDDQYIIPGGGLEDNETNIEGCIREVKEETGVIVNVKKEYLVIDEFFLNMEHINHYFICEVKEETNELNLTDLEIKHNLKSMWIDINEAIKIFEKYNDYKDNIPKYGLYRREYLALCKYLENKD